MRQFTFTGTATNGDVLSGTPLNQLEAGGQLDIYALSSAADTTITITGPDNEPLIQAARLPAETRAPRVQDDLPMTQEVLTGGHYVVAITIVSAATWQIVVIYRKEGLDY